MSQKHMLRWATALTAATVAVAGWAAMPTSGTVAAAAAPAPQQGTSFTQAFSEGSPTTGAMFRWWWPAAFVDETELIKQLRAIAAAGYKGVEIADVHDGITKPFDAAAAPWGGERWRNAVKAVAAEAVDLGLQVDLTLGARWPAAVPGLNVNGPASSKEIITGRSVVTAGQTFQGPVPAPPTKTYADRKVVNGTVVTTQKPITTTLIGATAIRCVVDCAEATPKVRLASSIDLADRVVNGELTWTAPAEGTWTVVGHWSRGTAQRNDAPYGSTAFVIDSPESRVVDYFSKAGTNAFLDWFDATLDPETKALLAQTGGSIFEDSLELTHSAPWTPTFLEEFRDRRGYDLTPYLGVTSTNPATGPFVEPVKVFAFDDATMAARIDRDVEQTVEDLWLQNHAKPMMAYAKSLGLTYRTQPYGENFDLASVAATVDIIECETLACSESDWAAMSAGAAAAGSPLVSNELLPLGFGNNYGTYQSDIVRVANETYAFGATQAVMHGLPYTTEPPAADGSEANGPAAWPGFHGFQAGIGEAMGPRQPSWVDQRTYGEYLNRTQLVLQTGVRRTDVAVYTALLNHLGTGEGVDALPTAGYTYGYVSPELLENPSMNVRNGRLNPDGAAYRALAVVDESTMSIAAATRILDAAKAGLPVYVVGGSPTATPTWGRSTAAVSAADTMLRAVWSELKALPHVVQLASADALPARLDADGVRATVRAEGLRSQHRSTSAADLYYLYNPGDENVSTTVELPATAATRPYELDSWTGSIDPVGTFERQGDLVRTRVTIPAGGSEILAIADGSFTATPVPATHVVSTTASDASWNGSEVTVTADAPGTYSTVLSDGRTVTSVATVGASSDVGGWQLSLDEWTPGATSTTTTHTTRAIGSTSLVAWRQIAGLEDSVGIGTYTSTVTVGGAAGERYRLDLGAVNGSVSVEVNGRSAVPVDQLDPVVDLTGLVKPGANTVSVRVASNLLNRLRTVNPTGYGARARQDYGLLGPVSLQTLDRQVVATPAPAPAPAATATTTTLKVKPATVRVGASKRAVAVVRVAGAAPRGGRVWIRDNGRVVAKVKLQAGRTVRIELPRYSQVRKHRIRAIFRGTTTADLSRSKVVVLRVKR